MMVIISYKDESSLETSGSGVTISTDREVVILEEVKTITDTDTKAATKTAYSTQTLQYTNSEEDKEL